MPTTATGTMAIGHEYQLSMFFALSPDGSRWPYTTPCNAVPRYANPSMRPVAVPAALRPPKSWLATPASIPFTPITAIDMMTITQLIAAGGAKKRGKDAPPHGD